MKINIRNQTVLKMLELIKKHKENRLSRNELEALLDHDDYKVEFERYNVEGLPITTITKEEFIAYFLHINQIVMKDIKNDRLKMHHPYYKRFFDNLELYEQEIMKLLAIDESVFKEGLKYTIGGLPSDISFEKIDIIFTISIGNSFGWPHKDAVHFDVLQFFDMCNINNLESLKAFVGHEVHHIGFNKFSQGVNLGMFSPEEYLYYFLAFEGLAVKYCNNGEGFLTKKLYTEIEPNIGMDSYTWDYLSKDFEDMFVHFKAQIEMMRNGEIKENEIENLLSDYWLNLHTKEQEEKDVPKLKHSRNYYFGNEIWGLIHDIYGKDKVFELLKNPKEFPKAFNLAVQQIGRADLII